MEADYRRIQQRLIALRKATGLNQEETAELLGMAYKHYQAVESGRTKDIRFSTIVRIADGYDLMEWKLLHPDMPELSKRCIEHAGFIKRRKEITRKSRERV